MNTLPQDLEDIIIDYKQQFEKAELQQNIDDNNNKINSVRVLCSNKEYIINKSIEDEISKTSQGFDAGSGRNMAIDKYYKDYEQGK